MKKALSSLQCHDRHGRNPLNIVCLQESCKANNLICTMCHYESHQNHPAVTIDVFLKAHSVKLNSTSKDFQKLMHDALEEKKRQVHTNVIGLQEQLKGLFEIFSSTLSTEFQLPYNPPFLKKNVHERPKRKRSSSSSSSSSQSSSSSSSSPPDSRSKRQQKKRRLLQMRKKEKKLQQKKRERSRIKKKSFKEDDFSQKEAKSEKQKKNAPSNRPDIPSPTKPIHKLKPNPRSFQQKAKLNQSQSGLHVSRGPNFSFALTTTVEPKRKKNVEKEEKQKKNIDEVRQLNAEQQVNTDLVKLEPEFAQMKILTRYDEMKREPEKYSEQELKKEFLESLQIKGESCLERVIQHKVKEQNGRKIKYYLLYFDKQFSWHPEKELSEWESSIRRYWKDQNDQQ